MNRKKLLLLLGLAAALTLAGCGKETETEPAASAPEKLTSAAADAEDTGAEAGDAGEETADAAETAVEEDMAEEETAAETEAALEPVTPSDYLVKDIDDYVTLGDTSNLSVTQYTYEVTDETLQERIDMELSVYSEESEVDRASQAGDVVYVDLTATVQDSEASEYTESTFFTLGDEEYGAEFDSELTGASAGDVLNFTLSFDDSIWMEEWMDQTVDFEVTVTSVCEILTPEYNDDFVSENTDYATVAEFEEGMREELTLENAETSNMEAVESLMQTVEETSVFAGYPQELFDECKEETLAFYAAFAGTTDEAEIYELFDIDETYIEEEVLTQVNRRLIISAICEKNGLEVTEDEYVAYVTEYAAYYGYDSAADFEADNGRGALIWSLYETKAGDYLYENADITEEAYTEEELDLTVIEEGGDEDAEVSVMEEDTDADAEVSETEAAEAETTESVTE